MVTIIWILILVGVGSVVLPYAGRWWQCQQLAPIERVFTRGC